MGCGRSRSRVVPPAHINAVSDDQPVPDDLFEKCYSALRECEIGSHWSKDTFEPFWCSTLGSQVFPSAKIVQLGQGGRDSDFSFFFFVCCGNVTVLPSLLLNRICYSDMTSLCCCKNEFSAEERNHFVSFLANIAACSAPFTRGVSTLCEFDSGTNQDAILYNLDHHFCKLRPLAISWKETQNGFELVGVTPVFGEAADEIKAAIGNRPARGALHGTLSTWM